MRDWPEIDTQGTPSPSVNILVALAVCEHGRHQLHHLTQPLGGDKVVLSRLQGFMSSMSIATPSFMSFRGQTPVPSNWEASSCMMRLP